MEAALVFPLVIVIAVTMLYMMVGLYEEAESSAENQMAFRQKAAEAAETGCGGALGNSGAEETYATDITKSGYRFFSGNSSYDYGSKGILNFSGSKSYIVEEVILDEEAFVRLTDAGRSML